eukprot:INCI273.1.p1 GENE.INCI273.1~~INCI273.1.p1  ORF type:complete len:454 (-),score=95.12 INCI273.1:42-1403(-)
MLVRSALARGSSRLLSQAHRRVRCVGSAALAPQPKHRLPSHSLRRRYPQSLTSSSSSTSSQLGGSKVPSAGARLMSSAQPPPSDSQTSSEQGASATSATSSAGSAGGAGGGEKKQLPSVVEVDASNIEQVMVQSYGMPTILDCHAEWCQPCKQLAPILEDLVARSGGRLRLAKLDVDANKELAAQLRVQSLPTVYGIAGGKVVDQFVGLPQQEQFQSFVDKLMKHGESSAAAGAAPADSTGSKTPAEIFDAGAMALRQGAFDVARNAFETVIALEESEADAIAAKTKRDGGRKLTPKTDEQVKIEEMAAAAHASIAQLLLMSGDAEAAQSYLSTFRKKPKWSQYLHMPQVSQPVAIVELYANTDGIEQDITKVEATLAANPNDLDARYALASHMMLQGKPQEALNEAFLILRKDKDWKKGQARQFCVNVFNALGENNPIVTAGRRRLSNIVFA